MSLESSSSSTMESITEQSPTKLIKSTVLSTKLNKLAPPSSFKLLMSPELEAGKIKKKNPFDKQDIELDYYADLIRKPSRSKSIFKKINLYERVNLMNQNSIELHKSKRIYDTEKAKKKLYNQINYYNTIIHRNSLNKSTHHYSQGYDQSSINSKNNLQSAKNLSITKSIRMVLSAKPGNINQIMKQGSNDSKSAPQFLNNYKQNNHKTKSSLSSNSHNKLKHIPMLTTSSTSAKLFTNSSNKNNSHKNNNYLYNEDDEIETDYIIDDYDENAFENENVSTNRSLDTRLIFTSLKHKYYLKDLERRTKEFIKNLDKYKFNEDLSYDQSNQLNNEEFLVESSLMLNNSFIANGASNENNKNITNKSNNNHESSITNNHSILKLSSLPSNKNSNKLLPKSASSVSSASSNKKIVTITTLKDNQFKNKDKKGVEFVKIVKETKNPAIFTLSQSSTTKILNTPTTNQHKLDLSSKNERKKTLYDLYAIPSEVMLAHNLSTELGEILPRIVNNTNSDGKSSVSTRKKTSIF